uniref:C3H1-type domain-containing protein n=1 Tax=Macrostomum lignano TaxID=282301 RepID=A0A1I8G528_9PLAT
MDDTGRKRPLILNKVVGMYTGANEVNSDKHIYPVDVAKFNEKIKERFTGNQKQSGPVDVLALAHYAAEFAEEARLVLEEYTYPEVTIPTKPDAIGENFEWSLVCYSCAQPNDVLRSRWSRLQNECANCDKCILLVREKASTEPSDVWQRVRPRPRKLVKLDMCRRYSDIESCNGCNRSECDFAHGDAELRLWELERIGKFSFNKLLKSNRSAGSELPLILCERPAVEEGSETRIFYTGPEPLPARLPVKATKILLSALRTRFLKELSVNIIIEANASVHTVLRRSSCGTSCNRKEPELIGLEPRIELRLQADLLQVLRITGSSEKQIQAEGNTELRSECDFAHGDVELKLWKLERIGKFSFNKLLKSNRSAM